MKCASALSTERETAAALRDVADRAAAAMGDGPADLALFFATPHHAEAFGAIAAEVRRRGLARHVLGVTAESVAGEDREVEGGPGLSLWVLRYPGLELRPHRLTFENGEFRGVPEETSAPILLLCDPFSFPGDQLLSQVNERKRGLRVFGGMASGGQAPGRNRLVLDDRVYEDGAVAIEVGGPVVLRGVLSQGCRPIGRPLIVTRSERNVIRELGRRPAIDVLRELFETLPPDDQARVREGLHLGRVINEYQESFHRGDFLVRNVMGADDEGGIAITDHVRVGQTVQFHVRDAESADEDLRTLLDDAHRPGEEARVGGALLFSCNGRGRRLFDRPDHDVSLIREAYGPVAVAGFFAMGEIGPVGGQNFLHGYTASVVLFEEPGAPPG